MPHTVRTHPSLPPPLGVTPTTAKICFVKHTNRVGAPTRYADAQGHMIDEVEEKLLDLPLLQNLALVDTPGTNAVIQRHSQVGREGGREGWREGGRDAPRRRPRTYDR